MLQRRTRLGVLAAACLVLSGGGDARAEWPTFFGGIPRNVQPYDPALNDLLRDRCEEPPSWSVGIGAVLLGRDAPEANILALNSDTSIALTAADIDTDMNVGPWLELNRYERCGPDVQLRYFSVADMNSTVNLRDDAGLTPQFFNATPTTLPTEASFFVESDLQSFEANLLRRTGTPLTFLVGARYLNIDEQFNVTDIPNNLLSVSSADNRLYGGQLGVEALLWTRGLSRWTVASRGGLYYADIDVYAQVDDGAGNLSIFDGNEENLGYSHEVQTNLEIPMSRYGWLRVGYHFLMVGGVASAIDQSDNLSVATATGELQYDAIGYHGLHGSVLFVW
jgi:hypothetical protein